MTEVLLTYLLFINIAAFIMYGIDKKKAKKNKWRIKESTLLIMALIGGCYGALLGMYVFKHKTQKNKFKILVPLILILYTFILGRILL